MKIFRRVVAACLFGISPNLVASPLIFPYIAIGNLLPVFTKVAEVNLIRAQQDDDRCLESCIEGINESSSSVLTKNIYAKLIAGYRYRASHELINASDSKNSLPHTFAAPLIFFYYLWQSGRGLDQSQTVLFQTAYNVRMSLPYSGKVAWAHAKYNKVCAESTTNQIEQTLCTKMTEQVFSSDLTLRIDEKGHYIKPKSLGKHHENLQKLRGVLYLPAENGGRTSKALTSQQLKLSIINDSYTRKNKTSLPEELMQEIDSFVPNENTSHWRPADYNQRAVIKGYKYILRKKVGTLPDSFYERNPGAQRFDRLWNTQA